MKLNNTEKYKYCNHHHELNDDVEIEIKKVFESASTRTKYNGKRLKNGEVSMIDNCFEYNENLECEDCGEKKRLQFGICCICGGEVINFKERETK